MKKKHDFAMPQGHTRRSILKGMTWGLCAVALTPVLSVSMAHAASTNAAKNTTLIVYYSHSGNTRQIVSQIQKTIQADVVELKTLVPYPEEYNALTKQAKQELKSGFRPSLSTKIPSMENYDTVVICSPNWWGTVAMPVFTFLDSSDLSSKRIAICITHEGSRLGNSVNDVKKIFPRATMLEGLAIRGGTVASAQKDVDDWLRKIGLAQ